MDDKQRKELAEALRKLEVAKLLTQLDDLEIPEAVDERNPMDRLVDELKQSNAIARRVKQRTAKPKRKKMHWKTARRKKNEYYQNVARYRRLELKGELLEEGPAGWWTYLTRLWKRHKVPVEMTEQEWTEVIWPTLEGRVPVIHRYQPNKPISLGNVYVTESENHKNVLFDGKEHALRAAGYIL